MKNKKQKFPPQPPQKREEKFECCLKCFFIGSVSEPSRCVVYNCSCHPQPKAECENCNTEIGMENNNYEKYCNDCRKGFCYFCVDYHHCRPQPKKEDCMQISKQAMDNPIEGWEKMPTDLWNFLVLEGLSITRVKEAWPIIRQAIKQAREDAVGNPLFIADKDGTINITEMITEARQEGYEDGYEKGFIAGRTIKVTIRSGDQEIEIPPAKDPIAEIKKQEQQRIIGILEGMRHTEIDCDCEGMGCSQKSTLSDAIKKIKKDEREKSKAQEDEAGKEGRYWHYQEIENLHIEEQQRILGILEKAQKQISGGGNGKRILAQVMEEIKK